jgi:hypothetical protein
MRNKQDITVFGNDHIFFPAGKTQANVPVERRLINRTLSLNVIKRREFFSIPAGRRVASFLQ